jgi:hypothetical protein
MEHPEARSPLTPDPPGREDIMSDEPRPDIADRERADASPLPPDPAHREDVITGDRRDGLADG